MAAALLLKFGLRVSPRTIRRDMARTTGGSGAVNQRWATLVRNHAQAVVACYSCVAVTATFRVLYGFVALEVGRHRLVHVNVTSHPTATWTLQQFREVLAAPQAQRCGLHDRDRRCSPWLDTVGAAMGVRVLRTPVHAPTANAFCERLLGSLRRARLDYLVPLGEDHVRTTLHVWRLHYNRGRPHSSLGPGLPDAPPG